MINYPAEWNKWAHNIDYSELLSYKKRPTKFLHSEQDNYLVKLQQQHGHGVEYVVEKSVSDDLSVASVGNVKFSDISWPSVSMEVYFEDPEIPSILIQRVRPEIIAKTTSDFGWKIRYIKEEFDQINVMTQDKNSHGMYVQFETDEFDAWLTGSGPKPVMEMDTLTILQANGLRDLVMLAYKVLLYASVPQLAPKKVTNRDLHHGGKSGVKGRAARPMFHVIDLPRQYREQKESVTRGGTRKFRGRHGHFHHYRAGRFVNKQGTFDYWPPVLGPDGTLPKIKYRVKSI